MVLNLIDRVKQTFRREKKLSAALYKILGFYPHNMEIYRVALSHKSQSYRNRNGRAQNNERLEYLGDAIIEAVVSDILFHRYPRKREGFLTSTRSKIVQRSSLNRLAAEIGLNDLIHTSERPLPRGNNIGGNAFEALVGAIYLDRGYRHCKWFIEKRIVDRQLDMDTVANKEVNFKSKLLEWTQKNRILNDYKFETHGQEGSSDLVFTSTIVLEGIAAGTGTGHSKKESQQLAAREALKRMRRDPKFLDSIYRSKEKRTAMEAEEICALPHIEEIDREIAAEAKGQKPARNANGNNQRRNQRQRNAEQKVRQSETPSQPAPAAAEETQSVKNERGKRRRNQRRPASAEKQAEESAAKETTEILVNEAPKVEAKAEAKPEPKPEPKQESKPEPKSEAVSAKPTESAKANEPEEKPTEQKAEDLQPKAEEQQSKAEDQQAKAEAPKSRKRSPRAKKVAEPDPAEGEAKSDSQTESKSEAEEAPKPKAAKPRTRRTTKKAQPAESAETAAPTAESAASSADASSSSAEPTSSSAASPAEPTAEKSAPKRRTPRRQSRAPKEDKSAEGISDAERQAIIDQAEASAYDAEK